MTEKHLLFAVPAGWVAVCVALCSLLMAGQERGNRSGADEAQADATDPVKEEVQARQGTDVGQKPLTLTGHASAVISVTFSPDGQWLASASNDRTVKVWGATSGQEALTLKGHTGLVYSVAFSPDGKRLASAGIDKTVKVWDVTPR